MSLRLEVAGLGIALDKTVSLWMNNLRCPSNSLYVETEREEGECEEREYEQRETEREEREYEEREAEREMERDSVTLPLRRLARNIL